MTAFGVALSSEELDPTTMVETARAAESRGIDRVWLSDHFHPWTGEQGESPFVWSVIGGIASTTGMRIGTGVTCPTVRIHPAIVAHAAATSQVMARGRFFLGVGSGEALNEHVLGDRWPEADVRLEMLEEAVEVMRRLWTGEEISHRGTHYTVSNARLYTCPDEPPPVYVSAFGPKATEVAARIGDGFANVSPEPSIVQGYRDAGGGGPVVGSAKVCVHKDRDEARRTVHRLWPNAALPGELAQVLPNPSHFEQAASLVTVDAASEGVPCGMDAGEHVEHLRRYVDAGYDEVFVQQVGPDQQTFLDFYVEDVLPALAG
jgi:G6PDH family F420-dependent oxidoreductase